MHTEHNTQSIDWHTAPYTLQRVPTPKNKNKDSSQFNVWTNKYTCVQKLITLSIKITTHNKQLQSPHSSLFSLKLAQYCGNSLAGDPLDWIYEEVEEEDYQLGV